MGPAFRSHSNTRTFWPAIEAKMFATYRAVVVAPLPALAGAQWSPDENRMLYVEAERRDGALAPRFLSLWTRRQTQQLCDLNRIGDVSGGAFSHSGEAAFLLAGAEAGLQVWMMALPRSVP